MQPVEILVHVSAASRGRDDARYRTEARGFLDFEPVERHVLCTSRQHERGDTIEELLSKGELYAPLTDNERDTQIPWGLETHESPKLSSRENDVLPAQKTSRRGMQRSYAPRANAKTKTGIGLLNGIGVHKGNASRKGHSIQQPWSNPKAENTAHLSKVQDTFGGELLVDRTPVQQPSAKGRTAANNTIEQIGGTEGQHQRPLNTPSTKKTENTTALQLTNVKETPRLLIERTPALTRSRIAPRATTPSRKAQSLRRIQSDSWQTPPSTIPDSQLKSSSKRSSEIADSSSLKRPRQLSSPSPTRPSPPKAKKPRIQIPSSPPSELLAHKSSAPTALPNSSTPAAPSSHRTPSPSTNPLEIHPPYPEPSKARFTTHLTPSLKLHTAGLPKSYPHNLKTQTRALHPSERGHWLVPFSRDPAFQKDIWDFLKRYITPGSAGFGVWAVREMVYADGEDRLGLDGSSPEQEEVLKIYCWGEIVAEVWLLMVIGGWSKIKGLGAQWIDAEGKVVVSMV